MNKQKYSEVRNPPQTVGEAPLATGHVPIEHVRKMERELDNALSDAKQYEVDCIRALHERNEAREVQQRLHEWNALSDDALRLRCGELSAQEVRTIRAVLRAIIQNATGEAQPTAK